MAARGHGDRDRGKDHRHHGCQPEEAAGAIERAADLRPAVGRRFQPRAAAERRAGVGGKALHRVGVSGHDQPVGDAAARLNEAGRLEIDEGQHHPRRDVEVVERGVGLLHDQGREPELARAQRHGVAQARTEGVRTTDGHPH
ncbi:MAG: hypothetical protein ACK5TT_07310, partial [Lysobacteraceae bacterium]